MRWIKLNFRTSFYGLLSHSTPVSKSVMAHRTEDIRRAMLDALGPSGSERFPQVARRTRYAPDIMGLWYLRGDLMAALASLQGEAAARQKIDGITTLFQGLLPGGMSSRPSPLMG